jgi:hypothetical protein
MEQKSCPKSNRWAAGGWRLARNPEDRIKECEVIKLGMQLMVKGPTQKVVGIKAQQLVRAGARLISAPSEATGGGWVAVFDDVEQMHKW